MDDLISRQAAIDALGEEPEVWLENDDYELGLNNQWHYDVDALMAVPSAQRWIPVSEGLPEDGIDAPERKFGKWKLNREGNWACPFCEFDPYHDEMNGMNYCPNCGARLRGFDNGKVH